MNQKDIVWARLPFSSLEESKVRPAVVVSNNEYNKKNLDIIICAITSNLEKRAHAIPIDNSNISTGKLPVKSKIRADKIMQIEKKLLLNTFARLNNDTFDVLVKEINILLQRK